MHFLLSSCTAAFGCHKVTLCQLCHSCLHFCPSLPAPLEHHFLKSLLQATFLHPTTFLTMCLPQPSTNTSTFTLPRHSWKYIPLIFLVCPPGLFMATTVTTSPIFLFSGHPSSSSAAQRRPLPHSVQATLAPQAFGWAWSPEVEDRAGATFPGNMIYYFTTGEHTLFPDFILKWAKSFSLIVLPQRCTKTPPCCSYSWWKMSGESSEARYHFKEQKHTPIREQSGNPSNRWHNQPCLKILFKLEIGGNFYFH